MASLRSSVVLRFTFRRYRAAFWLLRLVAAVGPRALILCNGLPIAEISVNGRRCKRFRWQCSIPSTTNRDYTAHG